MIVVVHLIISPFLFLPFNYFGDDQGFFLKELAYPLTAVCMFIDPFGNDVCCSADGFFDRIHAFFLIDEPFGLPFRVIVFLGNDDLCKRLQAFFPRNARPCLPFGLVRQVYVLQFSHCQCLYNSFLKPGCQLFLLFQAVQDSGTAGIHVLKLYKPVPDLSYHHFIHAACHFLAVTGYERYGGSAFQQSQGIKNKCFINAALRRNYRSIFFKVHENQMLCLTH